MATQLVLDREHPNRVVFSPSRGLDPLLDLRLRGAQVCPPFASYAPRSLIYLLSREWVATAQRVRTCNAAPDTCRCKP